MRKPLLFALIAVIVALLGGGAVLYSKYQKTSADLADVKAAEETARLQYAEAFNAIAEIQDSLSSISVAEGGAKLVSQELQSEQKLTQPDRAEVLESIAQLNASIQRTKEKIGNLEARLKKSGAKVSGLERMIANLKKSVTEKESLVAELTGQVETLTVKVAGLETTVAQDQTMLQEKDRTIEEKRREIGTVLYVVGSKKELESSGLIVTKGGVLGLGKTVQLTGTFDESKFTALDTDQSTVVRAPAITTAKEAKIKVLSAQPVTSYQIRVEGNEVVLEILDPKEFRKVKHLVIMTA